MKPIDIFITAYLRPKFLEQTIKYLVERTITPYRLFVINQGADPGVDFVASNLFGSKVFMTINLSKNVGIHAAWNIAAAMAESDYFITSDNDIYVPDLGRVPVDQPGMEKDKDWLARMIFFMDSMPDYGAISMHPHIFIGAAGIDPKDPEDVKERNMCGAVMRIMRREAVEKAGGWEHKIEAKRNHEERTICSRLQTAGYKVGITSRIRAYHPFGKDTGGNWGYPAEITPEMQGHNPQLKDEVLRFDNPEAYDPKTWLPL